MAVLANGRVQLEGASGRPDRGDARPDLEEDDRPHRARRLPGPITRSSPARLFAGNSVIHVLADTQPKGFDPVEGGLEDVYFSTLSTLRRAA